MTKKNKNNNTGNDRKEKKTLKRQKGEGTEKMAQK